MTMDFQNRQTKSSRAWEPPVDLEMQILGAWYSGAAWDELECLAGMRCNTIKAVMRSRGINPTRARVVKGTELAAQVVAAYDAGELLTEIARKHAVNVAQIHEVLKYAGHTKRRRPSVRPLSESRCNTLVEEYVAGATVDALAEKHGHGKQTVWRKLNAAGVLRHKVKMSLNSDTVMQMLGAFYVDAPWKEVGRLGGVGYAPACKFLRKCGIDTTRAIRWREDSRMDSVVAEYRAGTPVAEIAKKFGMHSPGQIYSALEAAGITETRRGPIPKRGYVSLRDCTLFTNYGMRLADYDKMLESQSGVCLLCGGVETWKGPNGKVLPLSVDHDHNTGKVRGLLCAHCNHGLGNFKDDLELLKRAIAYLEKYGGSK